MLRAVMFSIQCFKISNNQHSFFYLIKHKSQSNSTHTVKGFWGFGVLGQLGGRANGLDAVVSDKDRGIAKFIA